METAAVPQSAPSRRRSTLRRLSIHLWALTHIAIAWSNFLSRLRISKDPPALARNTAQLVRTLLAVGEALADQPAPGAPGSWRRAVWLHFRVHYFTHIVSGATAVAHQYSSELTADQLQRVIRLGSLALEYFEQGAKRFLEVPAQSWRQALMPSMQKNFLRMKRATRQTALHCNLAWAYVRLDVGDLARNHDTAFKHYELAAQTLERENIPGLFLSAATVWTKLATALLEYPTEHQRAHAERARDLLIKTRQILSRYRRPGATSPLIVGRHPRFFSLVRIAWGGAKLEVTGAADPSIVDALGPFFEVRVAEELGRAYLRLSDFRKACEEFDLALDQEKHLRGDPAIGRIHLQKALAYLERPDGDRRKNLLTAAKEAGTAIDQTGKGISVVPYVRALITDAQICLELDSSGLVQVDHRANMYGKVGNNLRIGARLARGAGLYFLLRETCFCLGKVYFRQNDIPNAYRALALAARVSDRLERTVRTPRLHRYWSGLGTPLYTLLVRAAYECTNVLDRDSNRYRVVLRSGLLYAERGRTVLLRSEIAKQNLIPRGADRHDVERLFSLRKNWHASELTLIELESAGQVNPTERVGFAGKGVPDRIGGGSYSLQRRILRS
jgi:tetratricopeptide (TPR) repeat protein